jgi:hypothetical protein
MARLPLIRPSATFSLREKELVEDQNESGKNNEDEI